MLMVDIVCHVDGSYSHVEVSVGVHPIIQFYGYGLAEDWLSFLTWKTTEPNPIRIGISVKDYIEANPSMAIYKRDDGNIVLDASKMGVRHLPFIRLH